MQEIQWWVDLLSQDDAEECLENLRRIAAQLETAMDAIVERQLPALQDSLHLQETTCARLADVRHRTIQRASQCTDQRPKQDAGPKVALVESDLAAEIKAATETLLLLNRRYSALLKHSGDTLRLLSGLYGSYRGPFQPVSGIQENLPTWSCEA